MINLLKNIFKQRKVEFVPTDINWKKKYECFVTFEPMRIDCDLTIIYHQNFFDE